jgi:hypothetical protein
MDEIAKQFENLEVSKSNYFTREYIKHKLKDDIDFQQHLKKLSCDKYIKYDIDDLYEQYINFIYLLHTL